MAQEFKNGDAVVVRVTGAKGKFIGKHPNDDKYIVAWLPPDGVRTLNAEAIEVPKKERWINILIANDPNGVEFPQFDLFESEAAAIAGAVKLHNYRRVATKKIEY